MHDVVVTLLGAAAGGFFGAALGALLAFVFCGLRVVLGVVAVIVTGDSTFLNAVGFGGMFGPQVSFAAAGVAAAAYAARRGWLDGGRDIVTPLIALKRYWWERPSASSAVSSRTAFCSSPVSTP
jgi:hypothetical protein